jgi:uncharacterized protein (TIGR00297 family)
MQLLLGFILALLVSYMAYHSRNLSGDGALAAIAVGTLIFGLGGWQWGVLLLLFFVSSSFLTHTFKNRKKDVAEEFSKSGQRDAGQVLGNGGLALVFVLAHTFLPQATWPWVGFAAALAAVNADTWATELGVLNPTSPRMITGLNKRVAKGTSGAVSLWGTAAAILGAALIGSFGAFLSPPGANWLFFLGITMAGLLGSLFDSFLGATVQAMYYCPKDQKETEKHPLHTCGTWTVHLRGWKWLNNDWVNLACSAAGALTGLLGILAFHKFLSIT